MDREGEVSSAGLGKQTYDSVGSTDSAQTPQSMREMLRFTEDHHKIAAMAKALASRLRRGARQIGIRSSEELELPLNPGLDELIEGLKRHAHAVCEFHFGGPGRRQDLG